VRQVKVYYEFPPSFICLLFAHIFALVKNFLVSFRGFEYISTSSRPFVGIIRGKISNVPRFGLFY